jgi:hypothetical protein
MDKESLNNTNGLSENQKDCFNAYINYKRGLDNSNYFKHEIYEIIKNQLSDISFLKLQLGIYYNSYINDIHNKMSDFEKDTFQHIKENNISGVHKEAILQIKSETENLLQTIVDKNIPKTSGAGRKKTEIKEAQEYLRKFVNEEHKSKFIQELKNQYQKSEPYIFNYVIRALIDMERLEQVNKNALKISFEKALDRKNQSQQNFNKQYSQDLKNNKEYNIIKKNIESIIETSLTK